MLEFHNVSARYGKLTALSDVTLSIAAGARVAIFGHNGAGKTTLLKCAVGALPDVDGEVTCAGARIAPGAVYRNTRLGIGFVPQGHNVFKSLDVERNLRIAGLLHDPLFVQQVYELFPVLAERRAQLAGSLSGGQQQMLALGMALMTQPKILLLDEPMSGLAPVIVDNVLASLARINERTQHRGRDRRAERQGDVAGRGARPHPQGRTAGVGRHERRARAQGRSVGVVLGRP